MKCIPIGLALMVFRGAITTLERALTEDDSLKVKTAIDHLREATAIYEDAERRTTVDSLIFATYRKIGSRDLIKSRTMLEIGSSRLRSSLQFA